MDPLVVYLNSHFSIWQNLDFFIRLIVACLCGICIGLERTRRLKEAGVRTHIIVCCASALFMIVSKYGFADLVSVLGVAYDGTRGADPSRVAAQVVSGISFLGAGRVVAQDDVRMDAAIQDGSFKTNPVFLKAIEDARKGGALHLLSYLTEKSSHGCIDYPLMLVEMAGGVEEIYLHIIFDGRSTEPGSAPAMLRALEERLEKLGRGRIVDGVGRGIALDRDGNYAKIQKAYECMVLGKGTQYR